MPPQFHQIFLLASLLTRALAAQQGQDVPSPPVEAGRSLAAAVRLTQQITTSTFQDFQGSVSPDGRWLAFVSNRSGNLDLWLRSLDLREITPERQLTTSPAADSMPCWSADGKEIVFCSNAEDPKGDIAVLHLKSGKIRRLTDRSTADSHPSWSPKGRWIAYASSPSSAEAEKIMALDLQSGRSKPLLSSLAARNPSYSPDGQFVTFDSLEGDSTGNIWVSGFDGSQTRQLTTGPSIDLLPCFSGDGKNILFVRFMDDTNLDGRLDTGDNPSLWSLPWTPAASRDTQNQPFQLTSSGYYSIFPAAWGKKLIYTSNQGRGLDLWSLPQEGLLVAGSDAQGQLQMARRLDEGQPPAPYLALMAYRRCIRDFPGLEEAAPAVVEARYLLAGLFFNLKNYGQAEEEFKTLISRHPDAGKFAWLGHLFLARIQFEKEMGATDDPAARRAAVDRAVNSLDEIFRSSQSEREVSSSILLSKADFWLRLGNDQAAQNKALEAFGRVLSDYPDLPDLCAEALFRRAAIYEGLGKDETLLEAYLTVLQSFPAAKSWCEKASLRIIKISLGSETSDEQKIQKLRQIAEKYRSLSTLPAIALNQLGDALYRLVESAKAKRAYEEVVRDYPQETRQVAQAQFALAQLYYTEQNYEKALEIYGQIQQRYRTGEELIYRLARERFILRKLEKAERHLRLYREPLAAMKEYQDLADFDPEILEAHRGLVAAADLLDQARLQRKAKSPPPKAEAGELQERHPELLKLLTRYQPPTERQERQDAAHEGIPLSVAYYVSGLIYTYFDPAEYLPTAVHFLRQSLSLNAQLVFPHQTLGYCLEQQAVEERSKKRSKRRQSSDFLRKAVEEYLTALALNDEESRESTEMELLLNVGNCFSQLGDPKQAYDYYAPAYRRYKLYREERKSPFDEDSRCLVFLERFGEAAFQRGDLEQSESSLRAALEIAKQQAGEAGASLQRLRLLSLARVSDRLAASLQDAEKHQEAAQYYLLVRDLNRTLGLAANEAKATRNLAYNLFMSSQNPGKDIAPDEQALVLALQNFEEVLKKVESQAQEKKPGDDSEGLIHLELEVELSGGSEISQGFDKAGEERLAYTYIGKIYRESLDYEKAIQAYQDKMKLYPESPPENRKAAVHTGRAVIHNQLGYFSFKLGRFEDARRHFEESLALAESIQAWTAATLNAANLGHLACHRLTLGEDLPVESVRSAVQHTRRALQRISSERVEDATGYRVLLFSQLGVLYHFLAERELESVTVSEREGRVTELSNALASLQDAGASLASFSRALELLQAQVASPSLALWRDLCTLHFNMALVAEGSGDRPAARESLAKARELADRYHLGAFQWKIRHREALLPEEKNSDKELAGLIEAAQTLESAPPIDPFPSSDQDLADQLYRRLVRRLAEQGKAEEAFLIAERAHEQALVAQTARQRFLFQNETYRSLAEGLGKALDKLRELRAELASTPPLSPPSGGAASDRHTELQKQYAEGLTRYRQKVEEIHRDYPEFAALWRVGVTPAQEIQQLFTEDNLLLKYYVSGDKLLVWALTAEGFSHQIVPWDASVPARLRSAKPEEAAAASQILSEKLLSPVSELAGKHRQIYVISDPRLADLPWESLQLPGGQRLMEHAELAFLTGANHYFFSYFKRSPHKNTLLASGKPEESLAGYLPSLAAGPTAITVDRFEREDQPESLLGLLHQYHAVLLGQAISLQAQAPLESSILRGPGLKRFNEVQAAQAFHVGQPYSMTEYNADLSNGLLTLSRVSSKDGFGAGASLGLLARAFTFAGFPTLLVHVPSLEAPEADPSHLEHFLQEFYRLWRERSAADALRQAQAAAAKAGVPASVWSRFRLLGHLGLGPAEARAFAQTHWEQSLQAAVRARDDGRWEDAVRYFENALSLVELLAVQEKLPAIYRNLAISAFKARLFKKAILYGEGQVFLLRRGKDENALAQALFDLGVIYNEAERYADGIAPLSEAASLFEKLGQKVNVFSTLGELGKVQQFSGEYLQAIRTLEETLSLGVELGDEAGVGTQLRLIGAVYYRRLNNNSKASQFFQKALEIFKRRADETGDAKDRRNVIRCLVDVGLVAERQADFDKAISLYTEALTQSQAIHEQRLESEALMNIGNSFWFQGDYQKAFEYQRRSLTLAREIADPFRHQVALNTAGLIYWTLNDFDRATENLEAALKICESLPGTNGRIELASTHNNIGLICRSRGDFEAALDHFGRARAIDEALQTDWGLAYDERNIGMTYLRMGRKQEAAESLESATQRSRKIGDATNLCKALYSLGEARFQLGDLDAARKTFEEALEIARKANIREIAWRSLQGIGQIAKALQQPGAAFERFHAAIEIVEQMRASIKIEEFKNGFATDKLDLYEDMILLLLDQGRPAEALNYCERSRARNFIDLLGNQKLEMASKTDTDFLQKQADLQREIASLEETFAQAEGAGKEEASQKLIAAARRYEDLLIDVRLNNPQLSSFVSVDPLKAEELQKLLEPGVTLVELLAGKTELITWVITSEKIHVHRAACCVPDLRTKIQNYRKLLQSVKDAQDEARELYDLIIRPVLPQLEGTQYLGIVPHDHLHYLSFASLTDGESYLIEKFPLFYAPSASVLKFSFARRNRPKNQRVLAVGNPDLENDAMALPFAEKEVNNIHWDFPEIDVLTGRDATEKAVVEQSRNYGIIHVASHGEFDSINPLLSRLLFARDEWNDGNLQVEEVFQLTLQADLVVLSACQSGLGKIERGDEIIGLNRAFTYAGTHSLLTTLWRVSDVSTAILVKHFYRNYAVQDKAASLRKAQLQVMRLYPHPAYWSAFVLAGDYK